MTLGRFPGHAKGRKASGGTGVGYGCGEGAATTGELPGVFCSTSAWSIQGGGRKGIPLHRRNRLHAFHERQENRNAAA